MLHIIYGFSQKNWKDEFSSKTVSVTSQNWKFEKKLDEFSSKTTCVTTRKMKISEKFLDEFWFANKG